MARRAALSTVKDGRDPAVVEAIARHIEPERIARSVDAAMRRSPYWFGVRHHSPAVARFLRAALRQRRGLLS